MDIKPPQQKDVIKSFQDNEVQLIRQHYTTDTAAAKTIARQHCACYYDRSMLTMASLIIDNFPAEAVCPGEPGVTFPLPQDLTVTDARGKRQGTLADFKGNKTIALVAADCPVSMTMAVAKARELARHQTANPLIVAPLQPLSDNRLAMAKMIRVERSCL